MTSITALNVKESANFSANTIENTLHSYQDFQSQRTDSMDKFNQIMQEMEHMIVKGDFKGAQKLMPQLNSNAQSYPIPLVGDIQAKSTKAKLYLVN